eukprot:scaffold90833_cov75-Phaeocystis_antarctica.AAC.4
MQCTCSAHAVHMHTPAPVEACGQGRVAEPVQLRVHAVRGHLQCMQCMYSAYAVYVQCMCSACEA